jgi:ATP-dependent Clp protease protease subunit
MKYTDRISDHIAQFQEHGLWVPGRILWLENGGAEDDPELDHSSASKLIKNLKVLESLGSGPITLYINCGGGSEIDGMAIYDMLKRSSCKIIGVVTGEASSMGSVVLQACSVRQATENAYFLLHDGTTEQKGSVRDVEARVEGDRKARLNCYRIYAERTGKPSKYWYRKLSKDLILFAKDALKENLIDEII